MCRSSATEREPRGRAGRGAARAAAHGGRPRQFRGRERRRGRRRDSRGRLAAVRGRLGAATRAGLLLGRADDRAAVQHGDPARDEEARRCAAAARSRGHPGGVGRRRGQHRPDLRRGGRASRPLERSAYAAATAARPLAGEWLLLPEITVPVVPAGSNVARLGRSLGMRCRGDLLRPDSGEDARELSARRASRALRRVLAAPSARSISRCRSRGRSPRISCAGSRPKGCVCRGSFPACSRATAAMCRGRRPLRRGRPRTQPLAAARGRDVGAAQELPASPSRPRDGAEARAAPDPPDDRRPAGRVRRAGCRDRTAGRRRPASCSHGHVTDDELRALHEQASATVFASWEEGFGLPVLESLWQGRPCLCHAGSAMAELVPGGGVLAVDMLDEDEIADALVVPCG